MTTMFTIMALPLVARTATALAPSSSSSIFRLGQTSTITHSLSLRLPPPSSTSTPPPTTSSSGLYASSSASQILSSNKNPTPAELFATMSVPQLKGLLRENKSKVSGNKPDLIQRLLAINNEQQLQTQKAEVQSSSSSSHKEGTNNNFQQNTSLKRVTRRASTNDSTSSSSSSGFDNLQIPKRILARLDEMGLTEPTPIQTKAIPYAIQGRDVMGLAQTGTGKTLAFGIPLVAQMLNTMRVSAKAPPRKPKSVRGLVLAPTRELANQIAVQLDSLTKHTPIQTFVVVGGQNIKTQINKLQSGTDLLVATPGRLLDLMDRKAVKLKDTSFLVLDEADLMLDMGFLRDLKKIAARLPPKRQTMLFSATMSKDMNQVASDYLTPGAVRVKVAKAGATADKVTQELHFVAKQDKGPKLLEHLNQHKEDRALVFGRTKHGMEKLSKKLIAAGIQAGSIHGNKSQPQRDKAIAAFKKGTIKVLVATDVAARGLDIPDVKHVYNYELPNVPEAYVHRIGRTARAGKEGAAVAFCSMEEMEDLMDIQKVMGMKIPIKSGTAWSKQECKAALNKNKERKLENQRKMRGERKVKPNRNNKLHDGKQQQAVSNNTAKPPPKRKRGPNSVQVRRAADRERVDAMLKNKTF